MICFNLMTWVGFFVCWFVLRFLFTFPVQVMAVYNLSFAAAGFLGIYHVGAAQAFLLHGDRLLGSLGACAGASAGAMVAALMVTAPDKLQVEWSSPPWSFWLQWSEGHFSKEDVYVLNKKRKI